MSTQKPAMKNKHLVGFHSDGKTAMLELCVFCKRMIDLNKIGECEHFAEKYVDTECSEFLKVDDISVRLSEALNARADRNE